MKRNLIGASFIASLFSLPCIGSVAQAAGTEILVGESVALTGALAEQGKDLSTGMKAYFDSINAKGGINGKKVVLIVKDDGSSAAKTYQNTQALISQGADVLAGYVGTPNISLVVRTKLLQKANIALVGPMTGADSLRAPSGTEEKKAGQGNYDLTADTVQEGYIPQLFHVRASYGDEARKIVKQAVSLGMQKIGVLYSDDAFGKSGLEAVNAALHEMHIEIAAKGIYNIKSGDVSGAVKTIHAVRPQAVVMIASTTPAGVFIKQYRALDPGAQLFALSTVDYRALGDAIGIEGEAHGVGISQVMPMPMSQLAAITKEHNRVMKEFADGERVDYNTMEGHLIAKVIVEAIKRGGVSREKMFGALESMRNFDTGGYIVNFGPGERRGSRYVDITVIGQDGELMR